MSAAAVRPRGRGRQIAYRRPWMYPKQRQAMFAPHRFVVVEASTKSGKAQPLDALVYTPSGPRLMGDLVAGDEVLTPYGTSIIQAIYPQGVREIYEVSFSDRSTVRCTADHLWQIDADRRDYRRGFVYRLERGELQRRRRVRLVWPRIVPLSALAQVAPKQLCRMWVPSSAPASFSAQPVPIDPYVLGVLLGDGGLTTESVRLSCRDPEILARFVNGLGSWYELRPNRADHTVALRKPYQLVPEAQRLIPQLRGLGLWGCGSHEKFVPERYKYNDVTVRREVLRGLLDTDGSVDKRGQPHLEQTSQRLAADIREMVEGLGGWCHEQTKVGSYRKQGRRTPCRLVYRQALVVPDAREVFTLPRKLARCRPRRKPMRRTLRMIRPAGLAEVQCIQIADARGLYLTDHAVPTHNTAGCMLWLFEQALAGGPGCNYWWLAPVYRQAKIAYRRYKRAIPKNLYRHNDGELTLTLPNGSVIWFRTAEDPDALYGEDVYAAVIDEAPRCRAETWHAVRTTLTATQGPARMIGHPKGKGTWHYQLGAQARAAMATDPRQRQWAYFRLTWRDAVAAKLFPEAEVDAAREELPESVFQELYEAEASETEGHPFGMDHIRECVLGPADELGEIVAWGWDLGKAADFTFGVGLDANATVCRLRRWRGVPWGETIRRINQETGRAGAWVDATGLGDPVFEQLAALPGGERYVPFVFTSASKQQLMERLAVEIQRHVPGLPDPAGAQWDAETRALAPVLREELESFEYQYVNRRVRYAAPEGMHDDGVAALGMAIAAVGAAPPIDLVLPLDLGQAQPFADAGGRGGQRWDEDSIP